MLSYGRRTINLMAYMKNILMMTLFVLSTTTVLANDKKLTEAEPQDAPSALDSGAITITTRPEIVGLWGMKIPQSKSCVEYYNFKSENQVVIKSDREWSTGIYEYRPSTDPDNLASELLLQIKFDNNENDCSGNKVDQTGEMSQYFVHWKSPTKIEFCSNEKAEKCFAELNRILP